MRRLRPSLLVFTVALLASLSVHLPVYEALGALADVLLHAPKPAKPTFVEMEMAPLAAEPHAERIQPKPDVPKPVAPEPEPKPEPTPKEPEPTPQLNEPEMALEQPPTPVPPPPEIQNQQAVEQKSDDPNVPPPENAQYLAEENRRVLEETNATVRSFQQDDPAPEPSSQPSEAKEDQPGDAVETEIADLQTVEVSEERTATEDEAKQEQPEHASEASGGEREAAAIAHDQPPPEPTVTPTREATPTQATGAPSGGEDETLIVHDAFGSFAIRKRADGRGEGDDGGALEAGMPAPNRQTRARSDARAARKPNLQLSWSQFEQAFGEERL